MPAVQLPASSRWPAGPPVPAGRTLLVSNRLPVTARYEQGEIRVQPSDGGLASGLRGVHRSKGGLWVGWSGLAEAVPADAHFVLARRLKEAGTIPVQLSTAEVAGYYRGYSNAALWPALHGGIREPVTVEQDWELYRTVNERYADIITRHLRPGDRVWIHDYHLLLLPALLRARCPEARIGFFLHTPFPAPACFAALPHAPDLLEGVLGSDLIGFHIRDYRRHFAAAVRLLLGRTFPSTTRGVQPRGTRLVTCPMGIDVSFFARWARKPAVLAKAAEIRRGAAGPLLVGVDRLDYTKGIPERLLAFERLLELEPSLRRRARLIQIAVPSRDDVIGYGETRRTVESLVARINLRFAEADWSPIDYRYCSVDTETLVALYRAADVMLVTPLCDGMNLVAKEFVACREDEQGVLVLSSRAGAAAELHAAVVTDPCDGNDLVRAYRTAITMTQGERQARMRRLRLAVESHDSARWSRSFLDSLGQPERPVGGQAWLREDGPAAQLRLV